ncbi:hypothetical protein [Bacillus subtilis]|uniref:hypothetical protein n=1 Tax=Bacillus subtilis TaxID=1423 RepID=UPI0023EC589B|nr:hypothetical protein [Bacillus subtilis]MDF4188573.1 hypothetical protein [Ligilactobacillus salivarius]MDF4200875.1 hypothetical protein [Bacillus subtilis]
MQKIKLMFEFGHGPIWDSEPFTGKLMTGIEIVDSDSDLEMWNRKCMDLYDECYEFNSHGKGCYFNEETLAKNKKKLLCILEQIKGRLEELNNNNFIIEDQATDELNKVD